MGPWLAHAAKPTAESVEVQVARCGPPDGHPHRGLCTICHKHQEQTWALSSLPRRRRPRNLADELVHAMRVCDGCLQAIADHLEELT